MFAKEMKYEIRYDARATKKLQQHKNPALQAAAKSNFSTKTTSLQEFLNDVFRNVSVNKFKQLGFSKTARDILGIVDRPLSEEKRKKIVIKQVKSLFAFVATIPANENEQLKVAPSIPDEQFESLIKTTPQETCKFIIDAVKHTFDNMVEEESIINEDKSETELVTCIDTPENSVNNYHQIGDKIYLITNGSLFPCKKKK